MAAPSYPAGTVLALLETASVTPPTRRALQARLAQPVTVAPRFFDRSSFAMLSAICARLTPPIEGVQWLDIAGTIDRTLADGIGDGWRYDAMPPDALAYPQGLQGMDQSACALFGAPFCQLEAGQQDSVLRAVQAGNAPGSVWQTLPAARFFEDLLAAAVQACYAHPLAQESIGYAGMADAPGWQAIGLDELEAREPRPVSSNKSRIA
ncbi:MAG: gluconate 2-dehydrogenase subunit 3 family protein [Polaromonas sp.]|nr:gluconate 2-dehydrogenase subunit 3 family protein [Polaromonas sp.]